MKHVFIINPQAGNGQLSRKIRRTLEELKTDSGFDYLAFDSEYQGHESILADKICSIFSDEPLRFYACGGSFSVESSGCASCAASDPAGASAGAGWSTTTSMPRAVWG